MEFCIKYLSFMVEKLFLIDGLENIAEDSQRKKLFVRVGYTREVSRALKDQIMNIKLGTLN